MYVMKKFFTILLGLIISALVFNACGQQSPSSFVSSSYSVSDHSLWDSLLHQHVNNSGLVNYQGFKKDSSFLNFYLKELTSNLPNETWSTNDRLAYWINLYNAATIKLILQHYPVESIKDIGASIQIPFINTPWQIKFIRMNRQKYNLDHIEHTIIRKRFKEPRIHFALVCAAKSCPSLRNEAYIGDQLDVQLSSQARVFLADTSKNNIKKDHAIISKLFRWYGGDFKKKSTLIEYLNQYSPEQIDKNSDIDYMDYHWELNEQK